MTEPTPGLPPDERAFTEELFGFELFWEKHKTKVIAGAIAVVLVMIGAGAWIANDYSQKREAERVFAMAKSPEGWKDVILRFPGTPPAEAAMLLIASSLREEKDLAASTLQYEEFLQLSPNSPLAGIARLGIAQNSMADNKDSQGLEELRLTAATGDPFAAPMALFLESRALVASNQFSEARAVVESLLTQYPESLPGRFAPGQIQQIDLVDPDAK